MKLFQPHSQTASASQNTFTEPETSACRPPLVCVYVITYNGKRFLERCFQTLQQLTDYGNRRLILVDNGSTDRSGDYLCESFPDVEVVRVFPNAGYAHASNEAIKHARLQGAKYVAILNDDIEILHSHWLREAVHYAEIDSSIGIITFVEATSDDGQLGLPQMPLTDINYLSAFAAVIPLEVFERIGMFDEGYFAYSEEDDLGARAQDAGYRLVRLGIPIYHLGGGTNQNYKMQSAYLQMRNGIRFCLKNRSPMHTLLRTLRIIDLACNPWPVTFDNRDVAHRRMRNTGNVVVNLFLWLRAVLWNIVRFPQTLRIRADERRFIRAALATRKDSAVASPPPANAAPAGQLT